MSVPPDILRRLLELQAEIDSLIAGTVVLSSATPQPIGTAAAGSGTAASKDDHVHAHGDQAGGSLHAVAVASGAAGFFSGTDKAKLDGVAASATNTPLGSTSPIVNGVAAAGSSGSASRQDHVHPTDTSRAAAGTNTDITGVTLDQSGLKLKGATSNALTIKPNETLSAGRTLSVVTGDANRSLTLSADATIGGTNSNDVTLGAVGSSPSANGASLSSQVLTLQPADGSHPGVITSGTQTIGGDKTWSGTAAFNGKVTLADGTTTWVAKVDQDHLTAFGGPGFLIGGNAHSGSGQYYTIGYGYATSTSKPPAEIGLIDTSTTGNHKGDLVFATRDVTTDTAPTERVRITSAGLVGIGRTPTANTLEVNGAIESKATGFIFPDGTTQATSATSGGAAFTAKDEGSTLTTSVTSMNFVGAGVVATHSSGDVTVTISGGSSTNPWSLATKPASANADDDEFEGSGNPSGLGWTLGGSQQATAIDPYANFSTATQWRYSNNVMRPSWLMIQPTADATNIVAIHKAHTFGTNEFIWSRMGWFSRYSGTVTNGDSVIGLILTASSGGAPSGDQILLFLMETDTNEYAVQFQKTDLGVTSTPVEAILALTNERLSFSCIGIQKISGTYHFWVAPDNGNWAWLGSFAYGGATLDRVGVVCSNANTGSPGNMVLGVDFIRFVTAAPWLP